jgi:hypothetical protein
MKTFELRSDGLLGDRDYKPLTVQRRVAERGSEWLHG